MCQTCSEYFTHVNLFNLQVMITFKDEEIEAQKGEVTCLIKVTQLESGGLRIWPKKLAPELCFNPINSAVFLGSTQPTLSTFWDFSSLNLTSTFKAEYDTLINSIH